jgi:hypothetical protein
MKRRQLLFWASFGIFSVGESLGIDALDRVAAAAIRFGNRGRRPAPPSISSSPVRHEAAKPVIVDEDPQTILDQREPLVEVPETGAEKKPGESHPKRIARHGRPPSQWLRSLEADELRVWLKTIEVGEAGVEGMTFWTHLTRDHYFDPKKIAGLTIDEQALLHAAAHAGY